MSNFCYIERSHPGQASDPNEALAPQTACRHTGSERHKPDLRSFRGCLRGRGGEARAQSVQGVERLNSCDLDQIAEMLPMSTGPSRCP